MSEKETTTPETQAQHVARLNRKIADLEEALNTARGSLANADTDRKALAAELDRERKIHQEDHEILEIVTGRKGSHMWNPAVAKTWKAEQCAELARRTDHLLKVSAARDRLRAENKRRQESCRQAIKAITDEIGPPPESGASGMIPLTQAVHRAVARLKALAHDRGQLSDDFDKLLDVVSRTARALGADPDTPPENLPALAKGKSTTTGDFDELAAICDQTMLALGMDPDSEEVEAMPAVAATLAEDANGAAAIIHNLKEGRRRAAQGEQKDAGPIGAALIEQERIRQIRVWGYTADHDDKHTDGELLDAAVAYLLRSPSRWPWKDGGPDLRSSRWKQLRVAGALIAAELDRRFRAGEFQAKIITDPERDTHPPSPRPHHPPVPSGKRGARTRPRSTVPTPPIGCTFVDTIEGKGVRCGFCGVILETEQGGRKDPNPPGPPPAKYARALQEQARKAIEQTPAETRAAMEWIADWCTLLGDSAVTQNARLNTQSSWAQRNDREIASLRQSLTNLEGDVGDLEHLFRRLDGFTTGERLKITDRLDALEAIERKRQISREVPFSVTAAAVVKDPDDPSKWRAATSEEIAAFSGPMKAAAEENPGPNHPGGTLEFSCPAGCEHRVEIPPGTVTPDRVAEEITKQSGCTVDFEPGNTIRIHHHQPGPQPWW